MPLYLPLNLPQGCFITQGCACVCVISARTSRRLTPAYLAYVRALNCDNSAAPTVLKLALCWLTYSTLWWLVKLLRVNLLLNWLWRNMLWPFLLGLVWRPRVVITVRQRDATLVARTRAMVLG